MSTIGSLAVNIVANTSKFNAGVKGVYGAIGGLKSKLSLIGGAFEASMGGLLTWFARAGSELHDLSQATGIAVGELDFLKYAAEQSGTSIEALTKAARTLLQHGIDPNRFEEIATKIAGIKDPIQQAQSAMYYFGKKSGLAMRPLLKDLPALKKRFEELGGSITQGMVDDADELGDSWGDLMRSARNIAFVIADALKPAVVAVTKAIADNGKAVKQWLAEHQQIVIAVAAGVTAFVVLAPVLLTLSAAINVVAAASTALGVAFTFLSANPIVLTVFALKEAYAWWQKLHGATSSAGAPQQGNYISRHLAPQVAATGSGSAAPQGGDSSNASNDRMDKMIAYLAQIAGQPPVQLAHAGVR
jgi:hypothetical protein